MIILFCQSVDIALFVEQASRLLGMNVEQASRLLVVSCQLLVVSC
ncbi:MAG: hypothetical protein SXA11_22750 [Cyanobacteriota bacterium]|nr:hypothetical protein [Cyanobacteriota bacterium]